MNTPTVTPVPGGFVVATPLRDGDVLVEGFFLGEAQDGTPLTQPFTHQRVPQADVAKEVAEHIEDLQGFLAKEYAA
ncbi:hypothetical protein ACPCDX_28975 [Streptomyces koyangensis]|uniref:hypothetical protein n=1 Tax=Streptomyces koyangensis TaxID=188770 RepID=UPI003C2E8412